jgi:hypothetical protein
MGRAFLLIVVSALLMTLGFALAPAANGNADTATVGALQRCKRGGRSQLRPPDSSELYTPRVAQFVP